MQNLSVLLENLSEESRDYWVKELAIPLPVINMPTDFVQYSEKKSNRANLSIQLDEILNKKLKNVHSKFNTETIMIAAYCVLIARLSNEKDILIGVNKNNNLYPIRIFMEKIKKFNDILNLIKEKLENISENLLGEEEVLIYADDNLFQTTFSMNANEKFKNNSMINWQVKEKANNIIINVEYDANLFKSKTVERFTGYYDNILKSVLNEPKSNVYATNILSNEEIAMYEELNNTYVDFPRDKSISKMFEESVDKFPNNIAISSDKGQFTYKELNERANQLANALIEKGIEKGDFVTIFMERSLETITSIMGILKAGGVYVALDPKHPEERNSYIISDAKSTFIVANNLYIDKAKELLSNNTSVKEIILIEDDIDNFPTKNPHVYVSPEDLAYIIYTSGSTGKPKGTLIAHEGVVNLSCLIHKKFNVNENDILTQFSTYSFDASVWDTFGSLLWGARLHLLSEDERISIDAFADAIERTKATVITILPTVFFNQLATYLSEENCRKLSTIKRVAVGGEALSGEIVRAFQRKFKDSVEIVNLYGPTESTVVATGHRITSLIPEEQANIPIGKPFSNYQVYIANEENQLCPINVPGEVYISSVALAKGYLNREEKTKEVFINNPFKENSIIYKSGDVARILESGVIEYVGRKDSQVKVRGHRIEIGEIEDNLAKHCEIKDVAIIPKKDDSNETILVAYYTSKNNKQVETLELNRFLLEKLPSYMVPKYMNHLEEMPISPTGKIDRKKLATYEIYHVEENANYVAPENETQKIISDIWGQVLGLEQVGIYDDFFEIGGHSLKIMSVLVLLKPHFPGLKIGDFFTHRTVEQLSMRAEELKKKDSKCKENNKDGVSEIKELNEYPSSLNYKTKAETVAKFKNVLLTGATGYLGSHILYELLKSTDAKIYCLIRKSSNKSLIEKLSDTMRGYFGEEIIRFVNDRVVTIEGDLEKDKLGLSPKDEEFIKENIDNIMHTAADVRHFGDASHFEKVNTTSAKYLLDIAKFNKGTRFHQISTLGIPQDLSSIGEWETTISKEKFDDDLKLENVYTNSKLQAEKLIYKAGEEGVPVTVYRAGNLTCRFDNGKFQKNINSNAFYRMIKAMLLLGKAPKANCYLDFTPIDYASKVVVALASKEGTVGETFHICNPEQILYSSVVDMINNFGYKVELIDNAEYEKYLFDNSIDKDKEGVELAIAQLDGDGVDDWSYRFACPNTIKHADEECFDYTLIDQEFINRMLKHGIEVGYFPKL